MIITLLASLVLFLSKALSAPSTPQCSINLLTQSCEPYLKGVDVLNVSDTGRIFVNPMKAYPTPEVGTNGEAILKAPSKVLTRYGQIDVLLKTQGENIFEEIRKAAIDEIQGDSKEARNLRSRLEKVKLHTLMPGTAVHDEECLSNGIPRIGAFFS